MINTKFEAYKLRRVLKQSGVDFVFMRSEKNEYGEPDGEPLEVARLRGIYHETNSYVSNTVGDAATTRTKKQPMILCLCEDVASLDLQPGDTTTVPVGAPETHSKTLKYVGCVDVQNWGIIADLSLEEVDAFGDSKV